MLDRDDRCQSLTHIFPSQIVFVFFEKLVFLGIVIDNPCQGCPEALLMCSTLVGMDVIGKAHDCLVVASRILHSYFNRNVVHFAVSINRRFKDYILVFIDVLDIAGNPTLIVVILDLLHSISLISNGNSETTIEKGQFLHPLIELFKVKFYCFSENLWIRCKVNCRTCTVCLTDDF